MPSPVCSQAAIWAKRSSLRKASPSALWCSSRKWAPQDLLPGQGIAQHQLGQPEEIDQPQGLLQLRIGPISTAGQAQFGVEALLEGGHLGQAGLEPRGRAADAAALEHQRPQLAVKAVHWALTGYRQQGLDAGAGPGLRLAAGGMVGTDGRGGMARQPGRDRGGRNEVTIGQALHQGAGTKAVGAVLGIIGLPSTNNPGIELISW